LNPTTDRRPKAGQGGCRTREGNNLEGDTFAGVVDGERLFSRLGMPREGAVSEPETTRLIDHGDDSAWSDGGNRPQGDRRYYGRPD